MRICSKSLFVSLSLALAAVASQAGTNLVKNGSMNWAPDAPVYGEGLEPPDWERTSFMTTYNSIDYNALFGWGTPVTLSPDGGGYFGVVNPGEHNGGVMQTIDLLTVGQQYQVSFYQKAYSGIDQGPLFWAVTFGDETQNSPVISAAQTNYYGGEPWHLVTMDFTAAASSQVLKLIAKGLPNSAPEYLLLDGVQVTAVPEPSSVALLSLGMAGLWLRSRRRRAAA